jgi:hypothetical protein
MRRHPPAVAPFSNGQQPQLLFNSVGYKQHILSRLHVSIVIYILMHYIWASVMLRCVYVSLVLLTCDTREHRHRWRE